MRIPYGVFTIAQIADLHLGDNRIDPTNVRTMKDLRTLLDFENPGVGLAVLSGDTISSLSLRRNATDVWNLVASELAQRGVPHTSLLGNHDAMPFLNESVIANLTSETYHALQDSPGAHVSRAALVEHDASQSLSYTRVAPPQLLPAASVYALDILPPDSANPLFTIYHLDTGGGGTAQRVSANQAAWLQQQLDTRRQAHSVGAPAVAFHHIPLDEYRKAWASGDCVGTNGEDDVHAVEVDGYGPLALGRVMQDAPELLAAFAGHDHGNDFCCRLGRTHFCYGHKSSLKGFLPKPITVGMRLIDWNMTQTSWTVSTRIRYVDGSVSGYRLLGSGHYSS
jgi:hypothetical protein